MVIPTGVSKAPKITFCRLCKQLTNNNNHALKQSFAFICVVHPGQPRWTCGTGGHNTGLFREAPFWRYPLSLFYRISLTHYRIYHLGAYCLVVCPSFRFCTIWTAWTPRGRPCGLICIESCQINSRSSSPGEFFVHHTTALFYRIVRFPVCSFSVSLTSRVGSRLDPHRLA
jgi:hypothetical protein